MLRAAFQCYSHTPRGVRMFLSYWEPNVVRSLICFKSDFWTAILRVIHVCNQNVPGLWHDTMHIHVALVLYPTCLTPFCFNALPNSHHLLTSLLFNLTPLGWLRSVMQTPTFFHYSFWDYDLLFASCLLTSFYLRPLLHKTQPGVKTRAWW